MAKKPTIRGVLKKFIDSGYSSPKAADAAKKRWKDSQKPKPSPKRPPSTKGGRDRTDLQTPRGTRPVAPKPKAKAPSAKPKSPRPRVSALRRRPGR